MALIEVDLYDVELTFSPKAVIFGSADETVQRSPDGETDDGDGPDWSRPQDNPNPLGVVLFVLGIALAIWLGRRKMSSGQES